ncbi:type VI secretion system tip protein TssI/VgrG [Pseudomonas sp. nanlin1]|uniref:type VI secretion system tip protein TssI/VgrG n=1 Tax=Pseudomonas sp. nanlin1 TaxID=3040605 RepID=UPI00388DE659
MLMEQLSSLLNLQNRRLFKFTTSAAAAGEDLLLEHFFGNEALSKPYNFELSLLSQTPDVELKSLMGRSATIEIELADGATRYLNGYINSFATQGSDGGISRYSAILGPWLWMLGRRFDSRIFQDKTVEEVVVEVFSDFGALPKYEFRLQKPLKRYSYITQYRESDQNFIHRLLEGDGLFYYFEHTADSHLMVITDNSNTLTPLTQQPQIRFHTASVTETSDSITHWSAQRSLLAGKISVQTFDYRQPRNRLPVSMDSLTQQGEVDRYEVYDFPGQYTHGTYTDGESLVRNRIEALELLGKTFFGDSNCRAMKPGSTFELTQHYVHDAGSVDDRQFLLISVEHRGSNNYLTGGQAGYHNKFVCVRKKIAYRAQMNTRKPAISGPQTAIVVGPAGEEIFTDNLGRVKVQFHWDRQGQFDDKSSCWVRVAQSGASGGFGSIQIPRVGDEVVVVFLDGDPDRPLVMGSLYNSQNMPPWTLPQNKTQTGFVTRSINGKASNANFFRFEDKAGAEQVSLHAERNLDISTEGDESHAVGADLNIKVKGKHSETITLDASIAVEKGSYYVTSDNGEIKIKAATSIVMEVGSSKLIMSADGTIDLSGITVNVEGKNIINLNKSAN